WSLRSRTGVTGSWRRSTRSLRWPSCSGCCFTGWAGGTARPTPGGGSGARPGAVDGGAEAPRAVHAHGAGRDRRLLPALAVAARGALGLGAAAGGAEPGAFRVAAHAASAGSRTGVRGLRRGLYQRGADLAVGGGLGAATADG